MTAPILLGPHRLWHADCLDIFNQIPDQSIGMILVDLPYGSSGCKWDQVIPFEFLWPQYLRIIRQDGVIALFGTEPFTSVMVASNLPLFRYKWTWDKGQGGNFQLAALQPMNVTEDICIFSQGKSANGAKLKARYFPIKIPRDKPTRAGGRPSTTDLLHKNNMKALRKVYTDRFPTNILRYPKPTKKERRHPTQKPVDLCAYLIQTYTQPGEIVLDHCMGSGATGVACIRTGRTFYGVEKDKYYFPVARSWLEQEFFQAN